MADATINSNALFMESSERFSPCGGLKFRLGLILLPISDVERSRVPGSGLRTWSTQVKHHNHIR
jgi:hypothetical protein